MNRYARLGSYFGLAYAQYPLSPLGHRYIKYQPLKRLSSIISPFEGVLGLSQDLSLISILEALQEYLAHLALLMEEKPQSTNS